MGTLSSVNTPEMHKVTSMQELFIQNVQVKSKVWRHFIQLLMDKERKVKLKTTF